MATQILVDTIRDLLIDDQSELVIENGDLVFVRGLAAIAQECKIVVKTFAEEWFLDLDTGIRYFQAIFAQRTSPEVIKLVAKKEFRNALLAVEGVIRILQLDTDFDPGTRTLTVSWQVSTVLGNTSTESTVVNGTGNQ